VSAADPGSLVVLAVRVPAADAERAAGLLFEAGADGIEERDAPGAVELRTYGTQEAIAALQLRFEALGHMAALPYATHQEVAGDDWKERWAEGLAPVALTGSLTVVPEDGVTEPGLQVIVLERSLAFGFGEHPTTRMAARAVERLCRHRPGATVLDVGTGGGLLAIVAERAGARTVRGIDVDPEAVRIAARNAARNGAGRCAFDTSPMAAIIGPADVVVANIDARTLAAIAPDVARVLAPAGVIVLTGMLVEDEAEILAAYRRLGFERSRREEHEDWLLLELGR
jgi:ribosomal protein L11 methyltransferase